MGVNRVEMWLSRSVGIAMGMLGLGWGRQWGHVGWGDTREGTMEWG